MAVASWRGASGQLIASTALLGLQHIWCKVGDTCQPLEVRNACRFKVFGDMPVSFVKRWINLLHMARSSPNRAVVFGCRVTQCQSCCSGCAWIFCWTYASRYYCSLLPWLLLFGCVFCSTALGAVWHQDRLDFEQLSATYLARALTKVKWLLYFWDEKHTPGGIWLEMFGRAVLCQHRYGSRSGFFNWFRTTLLWCYAQSSAYKKRLEIAICGLTVCVDVV